MEPLRFVLDENIRGVLLDAIHRHNLVRPHEMIDAVEVGDTNTVPLQTSDPEVLTWAEESNRLLVSFDKRTLPRHLRDHLATGRHCPGILIPPPRPSLRRLVEALAAVAYASLPDEHRDSLTHLKL
jgi:hypothetical protein